MLQLIALYKCIFVLGVSTGKIESFNFLVVWAIMFKCFYNNTSTYLPACSCLPICCGLTNVLKTVEGKYFNVIIFLSGKPWNQRARSGLESIFSQYIVANKICSGSIFILTTDCSLYILISAVLPSEYSDWTIFWDIFLNLIHVRFLHVVLLTGCSLQSQNCSRTRQLYTG